MENDNNITVTIYRVQLSYCLNLCFLIFAYVCVCFYIGLSCLMLLYYYFLPLFNCAFYDIVTVSVNSDLE